jgi:hypothetical protein
MFSRGRLLQRTEIINLARLYSQTADREPKNPPQTGAVRRAPAPLVFTRHTDTLSRANRGTQLFTREVRLPSSPWPLSSRWRPPPAALVYLGGGGELLFKLHCSLPERHEVTAVL